MEETIATLVQSYPPMLYYSAKAVDELKQTRAGLCHPRPEAMSPNRCDADQSASDANWERYSQRGPGMAFLLRGPEKGTAWSKTGHNLLKLFRFGVICTGKHGSMGQPSIRNFCEVVSTALFAKLREEWNAVTRAASRRQLLDGGVVRLKTTHVQRIFRIVDEMRAETSSTPTTASHGSSSGTAATWSP